MGLPRGSMRGCKHGVAKSWARRSGVALRRIQSSPLPDTARLACVRALTRVSPAQASRHTGHRQFHCGKAPPPAEPSTIAVKRPIQGIMENASCRLEFGREVAVDLEADADFDERRSGPGHDHFLCSWFSSQPIQQLFLPPESASGLSRRRLGTIKNNAKSDLPARGNMRTFPPQVGFRTVGLGPRRPRR